ncbi:MAG: VOC family protein [Gemmatimonadaceae bacterium]
MLNKADAIATIAVKDLTAAKSFYEDKLGFEFVKGDEEMARSYRSGGSSLLVYKSEFAGTNQATTATWAVDDVDKTARALKEKGITFEHYDFPGVKLEGDVHVMGKRRNAWFKDPDGNILSIVNND